MNEPQIDDFDDFEEYQDALDSYWAAVDNAIDFYKENEAIENDS
jgi:hypothetical protein